MSAHIEHHLLHYLNFQHTDFDRGNQLLSANESAWQRGLVITDAAGLTFHLLATLRQHGHFPLLPLSIQERLEGNERDHTARVMAVSQEFAEFNRLLQSRSVRYLALKGLTCWPGFVDRLEHRVQYDHDFLIAEPNLTEARQLFEELGYSPLAPNSRLPVDHLPTLVKRSGWVWRGNLYDLEIPRAIELHFRLWDPDFDLIPIRFPDDHWDRAVFVKVPGMVVPTLCREHALLYGVLHAFRHLLRNDLRLSHLYEIAYFVHHQAGDDSFWSSFVGQSKHCAQTLKVAATIFFLAGHCFGNRTCPILDQLLREHLPAAAALWIEQFGRAEAMQCFRKSKSAFLLHWAFVEGPAKWSLLRRRWAPRHLPLPSFGIQVPRQNRDLGFRVKHRLLYITQLVKRAGFHLSQLGRFLVAFPLWRWRLRRRERCLSTTVGQ